MIYQAEGMGRLGRGLADTQLDGRKFQPKAWPFLLVAGLKGEESELGPFSSSGEVKGVVRQQGENGVSAVAQVWCSHRGYSGIPCIFCRQSNFLEPCRQVLEERVPERTRSEEADGKSGLG